MFLFGFAGIALITQIHGLGLERWSKRAIYVAFLVSALAVYGLTERRLAGLNDVIRIPVIDYLLILIIYGIFWLIFALLRGFARLRPAQPDTVA